MTQKQIETGMYIIDTEYRIVNVNRVTNEIYPSVKTGDCCYQCLALRDTPCDICPLHVPNALFYNSLRKEWIYANAAEIDYPGHGACYNIQFQLRQRVGDASAETVQEENMDEHILELSGGNADACAIGGYCEVGSPLSFANKQLLDYLGYDNREAFSQDIDGLVFNTIHPDDVERVTADLTQCALHGGSFETNYRIRHRDHTWSWIVSQGKRVESRNGSYSLLCVITDMAEFLARQAEIKTQNEELLRKELTSQTVLEHMPGGYHRCENAPGWPFLYFGSSFESITGWTREEIKTEFQNLFINLVLEEDIPLCAGIVREVEACGYSNSVYRLKKKGGGYIWVSDSTMRVDIGSTTFYHGVLADVTLHIEALENAKKLAEASSQAKSAFLFNASHDIRTPMNAIQGFAHIIDQNVENTALVKETVRKIIQSSKTLMTLLNDVLDLSHIERGKEFVDEQPMDMEVHATKLYEMFVSEMAERGIAFEMKNSLQHSHVLADNLKLTRIAMNLLSNAKKFTPAGGQVTFGFREQDFDGEKATYCLFVRDTGIGMSQEFQKRAFEQFERERSSTESGISGSGLGLAIIKRFCDLMQGECRIESEIGKGSLFTVSIPLKLSEPPKTLDNDQLKKIVFTGKRALLVEDNDFNREIARYVFESIGFAVDEAENGVVCLDKLLGFNAKTYDLILMDIQMPVMDGYMAAREIRRLGDPQISQIPIIAMTANAFESDREKCLEAGMDGHIGKPLEAETVLKELSRVLIRSVGNDQRP